MVVDPRRISKTFGGTVPASFQAGEAASQMTPSSPFSPGEPIAPFDGYSRTPRSHNFVPGTNISTRPRIHERVAFETLRGLIEAYDVAQMCIWHRIDSIRSLEWSLVAKSGYGGDVSDAIDIGMQVLAMPDRNQPFSSWLASWLYDILAYDAGTLYRLRNRRGDAVGLRVVDGTTVAPLLDYWGNTPTAAQPGDPEPPAYVQYANGLPWGWLTVGDLIYQPFRKVPNSPYGKAPLETILLNANTDLRFQAYFLQRFTDGNIPEAFASAPEDWSPDQIEQFQEYWDGAMYGDQAAKHQIKWMPGGSTLAWSNEKDFTDGFSLFLMRKTAAAYHVVPADLGFTENVNKSSGESQADVQHRVGDLPLLRHISGILSRFLQNDLGLPLDFIFDLGEEQADRLQQAQADKIYLELGVIGGSDIREMRYGLPEPDGQPMPRFISTTRSGPIPLASLYALAGQIDPETAAPEPGTQLPHAVFGGAEGVVPNPPIKTTPLAEEEFGPSAMPPAPPPQPVAKDSEGGGPAMPTAGITSATGIYSYDLAGHQHDEEPDDAQEAAKAAELAAFKRFVKARRRDRRWRDFTFTATDKIAAHNLNDSGRLAVRKASGEVAVAGLAVQAADTARVLMLQRALDPEDPASGMWEFPGGHLEGEESPLQGAWREWAEETGCMPPPGAQGGTWTSPNGIYQGIVWTVPSEGCVPICGDRDQIPNPDDPDGDITEALAWWDPDLLPGNPAVRQELLDNIDAALAALGGESVAKAAYPKGDAPTKGAPADWPGWQHDEAAANYWSEQIASSFKATLTVTAAEQLARDYLAKHQLPADSSKLDKARLTAETSEWLAARQLDLAKPLAKILPKVHADGYLIGLLSAKAAAAGKKRLKLDSWTPGDTDQALRAIADNEADEDYGQLADDAPGAAQHMADTRHDDLVRILVAGLLAGATALVLGRLLRDSLGSLSTALGIAVTEITRSSGLAALVGYRQAGVTQGQWVLDPSVNTCPICIANAGAGPRPIGAAYPSGNAYPPVHPRCRCSVVPA
jgi:8-oxo-dGTP pyrophosphatase MutT (NUDIX family)